MGDFPPKARGQFPGSPEALNQIKLLRAREQPRQFGSAHKNLTPDLVNGRFPRALLGVLRREARRLEPAE
uniref:Uncharacterized protein n=1 Tax=Hyaloperonospora arabidopsidis (strain Emoy2) TaxID=559515 RepID=M4C1J8_HYAAE